MTIFIDMIVFVMLFIVIWNLFKSMIKSFESKVEFLQKVFR